MPGDRLSQHAHDAVPTPRSLDPNGRQTLEMVLRFSEGRFAGLHYGRECERTNSLPRFFFLQVECRREGTERVFGTPTTVICCPRDQQQFRLRYFCEGCSERYTCERASSLCSAMSLGQSSRTALPKGSMSRASSAAAWASLKRPWFRVAATTCVEPWWYQRYPHVPHEVRMPWDFLCCTFEKKSSKLFTGQAARLSLAGRILRSGCVGDAYIRS